MRTATHREPQPPSSIREFIIPNPTSNVCRARTEQKNLFLAFAHSFFDLPPNISFIGLQSSFGGASGDQFIALEDSGGGSFCLPVNLLLEPVEVARAVAAAKLEKFRQTFEKEIQPHAG